DRQEVPEVAALDELHDNVILLGHHVAVDRQDLDDVGVPHRHAELALALEQVDAVLVVAPLAAQYLDGDHDTCLRVVGAVDAAETARGDLVQDAVAAEEVALEVALEQLAALPRG